MRRASTRSLHAFPQTLRNSRCGGQRGGDPWTVSGPCREIPGPFGCWPRCERSSAYRLGPELSSPSASAADFGENVPICAILRHALSERCPHRGTKCHTGVSRHPVDSGGIGPATRFDARGLDLSAGECLSRGQSSTDVLPGSMAATNNRKALARFALC